MFTSATDMDSDNHIKGALKCAGSSCVTTFFFFTAFIAETISVPSTWMAKQKHTSSDVTGNPQEVSL